MFLGVKKLEFKNSLYEFKNSLYGEIGAFLRTNAEIIRFKCREDS